jgi:hypothetical protein
MNDLKAEYGDRLWLAELDLSETASRYAVKMSADWIFYPQLFDLIDRL